MAGKQGERFSGHESFICRYGWLPKIYRAITADPLVFKDDDRATRVLGIGRNMVRSIQFWGEAMGIVEVGDAGHYAPGPLGKLLLADDGWDPHLENLESLWLLHWWLCTRANLAAWNLIFGEGGMARFEKRQLVDALASRGAFVNRALAASTLEQHATIFCHSYYQNDRNADDTSWCVLQDLSLIRSADDNDARNVYLLATKSPVGLSERVFAIALVDYLSSESVGNSRTSLQGVLKGPFSPGLVFHLDEAQLRYHLDILENGALKNALHFQDTADTQSVILDQNKVPRQYRIANKNTDKEVVNA